MNKPKVKSVFIDANILHYRIPTDLFFDASVLKLVKVYWSEGVIEEYLEHGPRVMVETAASNCTTYKLEDAEAYIKNRIENIKTHSRFILVEDYKEVELPENIISDKNDYHVLQAAHKKKVEKLISDDEGFFKGTSVVDALGITPTKADDFFFEMTQSESEHFFSILKETKAGIDNSLANRKPPKEALSYEQFLERVKKSKLTKIAEYIETHKSYLSGVGIF